MKDRKSQRPKRRSLKKGSSRSSRQTRTSSSTCSKSKKEDVLEIGEAEFLHIQCAAHALLLEHPGPIRPQVLVIKALYAYLISKGFKPQFKVCEDDEKAYRQQFNFENGKYPRS